MMLTSMRVVVVVQHIFSFQFGSHQAIFSQALLLRLLLLLLFVRPLPYTDGSETVAQAGMLNTQREDATELKKWTELMNRPKCVCFEKKLPLLLLLL